MKKIIDFIRSRYLKQNQHLQKKISEAENIEYLFRDKNGFVREFEESLKTSILSGSDSDAFSDTAKVYLKVDGESVLENYISLTSITKEDNNSSSIKFYDFLNTNLDKDEGVGVLQLKLLIFDRITNRSRYDVKINFKNARLVSNDLINFDHTGFFIEVDKRPII